MLTLTLGIANAAMIGTLLYFVLFNLGLQDGPIPQELLPALLPEGPVGIVFGRQPQPGLVFQAYALRPRIIGSDER